jgi:hypothetical protein
MLYVTVSRRLCRFWKRHPFLCGRRLLLVGFESPENDFRGVLAIDKGDLHPKVSPDTKKNRKEPVSSVRNVIIFVTELHGTEQTMLENVSAALFFFCTLGFPFLMV